MPRDNSDTAVEVIIARRRGNVARLNMELAIADSDRIETESAQNSAGAGSGTGLINREIIGGTGSGGTVRCFLGDTLILMSDWSEKPIKDVLLGERVKAFDSKGKLFDARVIGTMSAIKDSYLEVHFADGRKTSVTEKHRFWQKKGYLEIKKAKYVKTFTDKWEETKIVGMKKIVREVVVFNLTVEKYHNYIANRDGVSNTKLPADEL